MEITVSRRTVKNLELSFTAKVKNISVGMKGANN